MLSKIDIDILSALSKNAKVSLRELASSLGVAVSTLHRKVADLERSGTIKRFSIEIDYQRLGLHADCLVLLEMNNIREDSVRSLLEEVNSISNVYEAHIVMGHFDMLLRLRAQSNEEMLTAIQAISAHEAVRRTSTLISVKHIKSEKEIDLHELFKHIDRKGN
jgi:DNA-binding Lrp family transcriptional regulator